MKIVYTLLLLIGSNFCFAKTGCIPCTETGRDINCIIDVFSKALLSPEANVLVIKTLPYNPDFIEFTQETSFNIDKETGKIVFTKNNNIDREKHNEKTTNSMVSFFETIDSLNKCKEKTIISSSAMFWSMPIVIPEIGNTDLFWPNAGTLWVIAVGKDMSEKDDKAALYITPDIYNGLFRYPESTLQFSSKDFFADLKIIHTAVGDFDPTAIVGLTTTLKTPLAREVLQNVTKIKTDNDDLANKIADIIKEKGLSAVPSGVKSTADTAKKTADKTLKKEMDVNSINTPKP